MADETRRIPTVSTGTRAGGLPPPGRESPRMRLDLLEIVAWIIGLYLIVAGLVAIARAGFEDLTLFEPAVQVGGLPVTPLLAILYLLVGAALLVAGTGAVAERGLRVGGVLIGIVGAVWLIEPGAFEPYLGVTAQNGLVMLVMGVALAAMSFVPPLLIQRPGAETEPR
jgi:hypothetical protein